MKKNSINRKIFNLKFLLFIALLVILFIVFRNCFSDESWYDWVIAIFSSIVASLFVGIYYQFFYTEHVSENHFQIMEYLNEKNKSGIIKYYGNFSESIEDIKKEFEQSNRVEIYLTYGYTILNNLVLLTYTRFN